MAFETNLSNDFESKFQAKKIIRTREITSSPKGTSIKNKIICA